MWAAEVKKALAFQGNLESFGWVTAVRKIVYSTGSMLTGWAGLDARPFMQGDAEGNGLALWFLADDEIAPMQRNLQDTWAEREDVLAHTHDSMLIELFKSKLAGMTMHVPKLEYRNSYVGWTGTWEDCAVYKYLGYRSVALDDNVALFVKLFLAGAHFTVLPKAGPRHSVPGAIAKGNFERYSEPPKAHSHYNMTSAARAYPTGIDFPPKTNAPIVCALLTDQIKLTSSGEAEDSYFFQLEGWPAGGQKAGLVTHGADFGLHTATFWNISTFGMSPYSEKRGTNVFITTKSDPEPTKFKNYFKAGWDGYLKSYPAI
jgi:hypothetical protein